MLITNYSGFFCRIVFDLFNILMEKISVELYKKRSDKDVAVDCQQLLWRSKEIYSDSTHFSFIKNGRDKDGTLCI